MVDGGRRTAENKKNEKQKKKNKKKENIHLGSDHCRRSSAVFGIVFEFFGKCLETFKQIDYILSVKSGMVSREQERKK